MPGADAEERKRAELTLAAEIRTLYAQPRPDGSLRSLQDVAIELGMGWRKLNRIMDENQIPRRPVGGQAGSAGRPGLSEAEWSRRRKIAAKSSSVADFCVKLGLRPRRRLTQAEREHGIQIGGG